MAEVTLFIDNQTFKVKKEVLCEHSDYFKAMFSGNYVENAKEDIKIDVIDANSMSLILNYMNNGFIDLSAYSLNEIAELAVAANFLQISELIKQIEYCLDLQLSLTNWMEIMIIAESSSYSKLESLAAAFGLLSFKAMKAEYIPSIAKLYWYLSHSYLDTCNEIEVFKFGFEWIINRETGADALLLILCCLDMKKLTSSELKEMKTLVTDFPNSLASKVIDMLLELSEDNSESISIVSMTNRKQYLIETFTERVYNETFNLVKESKSRELKYVPSVPMWVVKNTKPEVVPHYMYTFTVEKGFEKWIEVAEKNLWGWNIVEWGPTRLVVVCGEHGRGTGIFMRDVKVYDTLRKEWISHGVELPQRRHGGVAILDDNMYVIGGVGGFRVVLDTAIIYDLKQRSFREIAKLPDIIQNPAVCTHNRSMYAAGHKNIYRYEHKDDVDTWTMIIETEIRTSTMISFKDYIYCTQNYFNHLFRFRPGTDMALEMVTYLSNPPAAMCNFGTRLVIFTRTMCGQSDRISVEEFIGYIDEHPRVLWSESNTILKINDVAGSCTLVMSIPPLKTDQPVYHKRYLNMYKDFE
ncbi:hypothetical protein ACJJTC_016315 [Scirpophaga incertulas]